jgi:hypothetical protein
MDVSGEGFGCLNFIAPKLTPWTTRLFNGGGYFKPGEDKNKADDSSRNLPTDDQ